MPLFLVSSVLDEGISSNHVRLVEAESALAVAQSLIAAARLRRTSSATRDR
jgi:hypothetical protein